MFFHNFSEFHFESGADEAGRGCLAGPVTAAAVVIDFKNDFVSDETSNYFLKTINDSKQLSEKQRFMLRPMVEKFSVSFAVTHIEPTVIDEINILNASIKAMQESVLQLNLTPKYVIIDGNAPFVSKNSFKPNSGRNFTPSEIDLLKSIPATSIVKGDSKYASIAAASILAKTYRDDYMNEIHQEFPMYNWAKNKGYPTKEHREAIRKYGVTKYHRLTFRLLNDIE